MAPKSGLKSGAAAAGTVVPVRLGSASEKEKAGSIEQRIEAYNAIAKVFGKDAFPTLWARTQNNLGIAYWARVQGSRAENLEAAIKAYEAALTVFTREAFPQDWDRIQGNLTLAYRARVQGCRAENLEAAIRAYEAALTVFSARPRRRLQRKPPQRARPSHRRRSLNRPVSRPRPAARLRHKPRRRVTHRGTAVSGEVSALQPTGRGERFAIRPRGEERGMAG